MISCFFGSLKISSCLNTLMPIIDASHSLQKPCKQGMALRTSKGFLNLDPPKPRLDWRAQKCKHKGPLGFRSKNS